MNKKIFELIQAVVKLLRKYCFFFYTKFYFINYILVWDLKKKTA